MKKHVNLRIHGRVQGVTFRASAQRLAEELGVHGLVRNESDGTVYIEAEGEQEKVEELIKWCQTGPRSSVVTEVEQEEGDWQSYKRFKIVK